MILQPGTGLASAVLSYTINPDRSMYRIEKAFRGIFLAPEDAVVIFTLRQYPRIFLVQGRHFSYASGRVKGLPVAGLKFKIFSRFR